MNFLANIYNGIMSGAHKKIHIEKMDGVTLPPFYAHDIPWGGEDYQLQEHRETKKQYGLRKLDAENRFEKDVADAASRLGLGSDDLAFILNMSSNEATVSASQKKQLAKAGIAHGINYFARNQFNTTKNVGGALANAAIGDTKPETTISAHVYFYKRI